MFTETAGAPQELGDTDSYRDDTVPGFSLEPATDEEEDEPKTKVHVVYSKNCLLLLHVNFGIKISFLHFIGTTFIAANTFVSKLQIKSLQIRTLSRGTCSL